MKKLVVFYSFEGNTRFIAQNMAQLLKADILELKPEREISRKGLLKYTRGGKQIFMKETPELKEYKANLADYDILAIGTPVWFFSFSPPIRTFLQENKLKNKKIIFFYTHEGRPGRALAHFKKEMKDNEIIGAIEFKKVFKNSQENIKKLEKFVQQLEEVR